MDTENFVTPPLFFFELLMVFFSLYIDAQKFLAVSEH